MQWSEAKKFIGPDGHEGDSSVKNKAGAYENII
jgi:hypothetical protein